MDCTEINIIFLVTSIILSILLIISELLARSRCAANSITEFIENMKYSHIQDDGSITHPSLWC